MKKKLLLIGITMGVLTCLNYQYTTPTKDLTLLNIDALATGEGPGPGSLTCYVTVSEATKDDYLAVEVRKCSSCQKVWAIGCNYRALC